MTNKEKTVNSVNRLNAMYLELKGEKEERRRKFKFNLATVLTVVAILGIVITIL
jgi:hypothetical protein